MITANQYAVSKQTIQNKHIKINLLNFQLSPVDELSGNCIGGSINVDANADIRRTCNIEMVVTDSSFAVESGSKIWLDKYIQILVGIDSFITGETEWFNQGIFIIDAPSYTYDAITHTLSFGGLDLMAKFTGQRNGYIPSIQTVVPQGSSVRNAIISTITQLGGFTKYVVEDCRLRDGTIQTVPYDIVINQGGTIYDLLVALRDILPYYQIYFDVDGVFHYEQIPMTTDDQVIADDDLFKQIVISENISTDFSAIKNSVEVFGADIEATYFATAVTKTADGDWTRITLTVPDYTVSAFGSLPNDYIYFGFTMPSNVVSSKVEIVLTDGTNATNVTALMDYLTGEFKGNVENLTSGQSYLIAVGHIGYRDIWKLYNYEQFHAIAKDENPNSPFDINGSVGEIYLPLYDGEYSNIVGTELCYERAKYELYLRTNIHDNITLSCVPVYYFDVNQLIKHAKEDTTEQKLYLIQSMTLDLSVDGTMSINAMRFYDFWSE